MILREKVLSVVFRKTGPKCRLISGSNSNINLYDHFIRQYCKIIFLLDHAVQRGPREKTVGFSMENCLKPSIQQNSNILNTDIDIRFRIYRIHFMVWMVKFHWNRYLYRISDGNFSPERSDMSDAYCISDNQFCNHVRICCFYSYCWL